MRTASRSLPHIASNLETASNDVPGITSNIARASVNLPALSDNLTRASVNLPALSDNLTRASYDLPPLADNLTEASADLPDITQNLNRASADLPAITGPVRNIAPETAANIQCISENLLTASQNANIITQRLANTTSGLGCWTIKPLVRATALVGPHSNARTEADLDFETQCWLFRAGVVGEYNRTFVNVQAGSKIADKAWLRFGMVQSHLGAGVDYELAPNFLFSGDLFDPDHLRMNALVDFHPKALGDSLWLNVGVYNLFQHASPGIGLTYRP